MNGDDLDLDSGTIFAPNSTSKRSPFLKNEGICDIHNLSALLIHAYMPTCLLLNTVSHLLEGMWENEKEMQGFLFPFFSLFFSFSSCC